MPIPAKVKVAVPQHEPCWLDLQAGVLKTVAIMEEAAAEGARLVVFGELVSSFSYIARDSGS